MKNISKVRPTDQPTNRQYFSLQIKIANYLYINNFSFFNNIYIVVGVGWSVGLRLESVGRSLRTNFWSGWSVGRRLEQKQPGWSKKVYSL